MGKRTIVVCVPTMQWFASGLNAAKRTRMHTSSNSWKWLTKRRNTLYGCFFGHSGVVVWETQALGLQKDFIKVLVGRANKPLERCQVYGESAALISSWIQCLSIPRLLEDQVWIELWGVGGLFRCFLVCTVFLVSVAVWYIFFCSWCVFY